MGVYVPGPRVGPLLVGVYVAPSHRGRATGVADALLDEIYVHDRRRGVGGEMLETILDDCRRRGLSQMFLEIESHNEGVRGFYARHGFTVDPSVWMSRTL